MRRIDELLDQYSSDHQNQTNQRIHMICVPAIVWSVTALLWTIPVTGSWFEPGAFSALAMFLAWAYYWRLSRKLAMGVFVCFLASVFLNRWIAETYGMSVIAGPGHCRVRRRLDRTVHRAQGGRSSAKLLHGCRVPADRTAVDPAQALPADRNWLLIRDIGSAAATCSWFR